jgi:pimeloyl-ACP methyl ester carboxylesterase
MHARVASAVAPATRPAVVLVHGLIVSSRYMIPTAVRLARSFRVYVPDLPGYGKSFDPEQVLDVPALADALARWLSAAGLGRVHLLANSYGCQVAADFAARYPDRLQRLVLAGPTVDPGSRPGLWLAARWLANVPLEPAALALVVARDLMDIGPRRAWREFEYMMADHIERKLPQIQAPTLIVRGGRDTTVSPAWAAEAARLVPDGRLVVVPGAPHTLNYNAPRALARLARAFFLAQARVGATA